MRNNKKIYDDKRLMKEWDFINNIDLDPQKLSDKSNKEAYWICELGHKYKTRIIHRTEGHGCPFCSGRKVLPGFNDLETWCKNNNIKLDKWDYKKNSLKPSECSRTSSKVVWWKCNICGYEYQNKIVNEMTNLYCPRCNKRNRTSFPEQAIFYYVKQCFPDAISLYSDIENGLTELDIFIPSKKIGIEYDGMAWHSSPKALEREKNKYLTCQRLGIYLYRFKEKNNSKNITSDEIFKSSYNESIEKFEKEIQKFINIFTSNIIVDLKKDRNLILSQFIEIMKKNSLEEKFPEIAREWDYEANDPIKPNMIPAYSNEKFYFKCSKGHSFLSNVSKRTSRNDGCPYCSGRKVLKGYNDIQTLYPDLAKEFDYEENYPLKPDSISKGYEKKVFWICSKCKNKFYSSPNSRISLNVGCPKCNGGISKKVNQYTLDGKYIKTYNNCSEAGRTIGVSGSAISNAIHRKTTSGNYLWEYYDGNINDIQKYVKKMIHCKKVEQYSLNGILIATYNSIKEAQEKTGANKIGMVCNGKRKSSGGFVWKWAEF